MLLRELGTELRLLVSALALSAIVAGMTGAVAAAPGECTVTGYGTFPCDVAMDGAGLTFALPDGDSFAFALVSEGEGLGYLIAEDAAPGRRPKEMGGFEPAPGQQGCWRSTKDQSFQFCAAIEQ